jgi:hypothetical protein
LGVRLFRGEREREGEGERERREREGERREVHGMHHYVTQDALSDSQNTSSQLPGCA